MLIFGCCICSTSPPFYRYICGCVCEVINQAEQWCGACPSETDAVPHVHPVSQHGRSQTDTRLHRHHLPCPEYDTQSRGSCGQTHTAVTSICPPQSQAMTSSWYGNGTFEVLATGRDGKRKRENHQNWCTVTMTQTSELQKIRSRIIVYSEVGVRAQMRSPDDQQGMMGRLSADYVAHLSERQTVPELSFLFSLFLRWDFSRERLDLFILFLHFSAQQVVLLSVRVRKWPFHLWV